MNNSQERILAHGGCLTDLTDLLYFDKLVYPVTQVLIRPDTLQPGYTGYPAQEFISKDILSLLTTNGMVVTPGELIFKLPDTEEPISSFSQQMEKNIAEEVKIMAEIFLGSLDLPASDTEVNIWLQGLDSKAMRLADHSTSSGKQVVAKFYAQDVYKTLQPGWSSVLSIAFPSMPCWTLGHMERLDEVINFLNDKETKQKRTALFNWYSGVEVAVKENLTTIDEILDQIATLLQDYVDWLRQSGLFTGGRTFELLMRFDDWIIDALTNAVRSQSSQNLFMISKRGLSLDGGVSQNLKREIAYISHTKRNWKDWFPML